MPVMPGPPTVPAQQRRHQTHQTSASGSWAFVLASAREPWNQGSGRLLHAHPLASSMAGPILAAKAARLAADASGTQNAAVILAVQLQGCCWLVSCNSGRQLELDDTRHAKALETLCSPCVQDYYYHRCLLPESSYLRREGG